MPHCILDIIQESQAIQQLSPLAVDVSVECLEEWRTGSRSVIIGTILHSFEVQTLIGLTGAMDSERGKKLRVSEARCISSKVSSVCFTEIDGSF